MKFAFLSLTFLCLLNCVASPTSTEPLPAKSVQPSGIKIYTMEQPDKVYKLPAVLNEISGITILDSLHAAVVQDEKGIVFIINLVTGEMVNQHTFDSNGDFEGIALADSALYILRSDGRLTAWEDFNMQTGTGDIRNYELKLQTVDNEGLCYDKLNNRLLIAGKSKPVSSDESAERYIYGFDLGKKELLSQPALKINVHELSAFAKGAGFSTEISSKGKPKAFNFRPSDLSIHPQSGELYILSATDQMMVTMDTSGQPLKISALSSSLFPKPEGIAFLPDNTMLISNEADGKVATILRYSLK